MERCPNCGNKLSNIDVLCPRCGTVVEVIQIKNNISAEAASSVPAESKIKKKDIPQSFIVYNEDFPADAESMESHAEEAPAVSEFAAASAGAPSDAAGPAAGQDVPDRYGRQPDIDEAAQGSVSGGNGGEADNDYSPRYLENLMNIDLPEIDDLQNFDPDEFMREYKRSKLSSAPAEQPALKKRWLEIEEPGAEATQSKGYEASEPITQRRYKGTLAQPEEEPEERASLKREERTALRREERASERLKEQAAEKQEEVKPAPPKAMKRKKSNAMLSVLLWVLVTAALFFCFIFFDKYVQKAYGNYDNLIYSITNGKVELGQHN